MSRPLSQGVALLRGINVGGNNRLPMRDLSALFAEAGCSRVRTYIQSGNVVFEAAEDPSARVEAALAARFGKPLPVVWRTESEVRAVQGACPFDGAELALLHVAFLADVPSAARVAALDPNRSPGDRWVVVGRDVHLHLGNGVGKSKLTNDWLDRGLATVSTWRNWRTVGALVDLLDG